MVKVTNSISLKHNGASIIKETHNKLLEKVNYGPYAYNTYNIHI
jgi:hypothetical protein